MVMAPRKLSLDGDEFELENGDSFGIDDLLHPAQAFSHPSDVVNDPDLTLNEKRAILAPGLPMPVPSRRCRACVPLLQGKAGW